MEDTFTHLLEVEKAFVEVLEANLVKFDATLAFVAICATP